MHKLHLDKSRQPFPPPLSTTQFLSRCSLLAESMKIAAITGNLGCLHCLPAALTSDWLSGCVVGCGDG